MICRSRIILDRNISLPMGRLILFFIIPMFSIQIASADTCGLFGVRSRPAFFSFHRLTAYLDRPAHDAWRAFGVRMRALGRRDLTVDQVIEETQKQLQATMSGWAYKTQVRFIHYFLKLRHQGSAEYFSVFRDLRARLGADDSTLDWAVVEWFLQSLRELEDPRFWKVLAEVAHYEVKNFSSNLLSVGNFYVESIRMAYPFGVSSQALTEVLEPLIDISYRRMRDKKNYPSDPDIQRGLVEVYRHAFSLQFRR